MSQGEGAIRILGSLRAEDGKGIVRIEDRLDHPVDEIWAAITEPARLADWHAQVEGDLRPGGEFRIYAASDDWEGSGRVKACEAPRRLLVTTRESDKSWKKGEGTAPFDNEVEVTLAPEGDQTLLVVEVRGIPTDVLFAYGAGWQIHAENLASYLDGREPGDVGDRWDALRPSYEEMAACIEEP